MPYLTPTATVRWKSRCTCSGVAEVARSKSFCASPSSASRTAPPTHHASWPASSRRRAMSITSSGMGMRVGQHHQASIPAPNGKPGGMAHHQFHPRLRRRARAGGDGAGLQEPRAAPLVRVDRQHLALEAARGQHDRLSGLEPALGGAGHGGRQVSAAEGHDDQSVVPVPRRVDHRAGVADHGRHHGDPGGERPGPPGERRRRAPARREPHRSAGHHPERRAARRAKGVHLSRVGLHGLEAAQHRAVQHHHGAAAPALGRPGHPRAVHQVPPAVPFLLFRRAHGAGQDHRNASGRACAPAGTRSPRACRCRA